jgi:large subunit ribosomal protein L18
MIRIKLKNKTSTKVTKRLKNKARIRKKVEGHAERPRLTVFRSGRHIYAQIVDDMAGKTLVSHSTQIAKAKNAQCRNGESSGNGAREESFGKKH